MGTSTVIANSAPTTPVVVETKSGKVMGYNFNGVNHFYGIPYATAERFEMPQPVEPWEGIRPCLMHGEVAPQGKTKMNVFDAMNYSDEMVENENSCLVLNVMTPDLSPDAKKPVIFWIHGGGFDSGASNEYVFYDGSNLARFGNIVFVSINHRLNVLGFLDLSAYGDQYKYSGNLGMADIVAALEWVRDNIEQFGGDPNNVTIEGQSGGGSKVTTLMGMPAAKGLFHKAVVQSGGTVKVTRTTEQARAETEKLIKILGITENVVETLKALPYDELYEAYKKAGIRSGPVVDGDYYPDGTFAMSSDIPLMVGTVLSEFTTNLGGFLLGYPSSEEALRQASILGLTDDEIEQKYKEKFGDKAEAVMEAFKKAYPDHNLAEGLYINNRKYGFVSSERLAVAMENYGGTVYQYVQAYGYPFFGGISPVHTASCVPFFLHNLDMIPAWIAGDEETAYRVSDQMAGALVQFAYTGNPSQDDLEWENFTSENGAVMVFDRVSGVRYHHDDELMELLR